MLKQRLTNYINRHGPVSYDDIKHTMPLIDEHIVKSMLAQLSHEEKIVELEYSTNCLSLQTYTIYFPATTRFIQSKHMAEV